MGFAADCVGLEFGLSDDPIGHCLGFADHQVSRPLGQHEGLAYRFVGRPLARQALGPIGAVGELTKTSVKFINARRDEVEEAWQFVDSIEQAWHGSTDGSATNQAGADGSPELFEYPAGSWGPKEADELLARDGRTWRRF